MKNPTSPATNHVQHSDTFHLIAEDHRGSPRCDGLGKHRLISPSGSEFPSRWQSSSPPTHHLPTVAEQQRHMLQSSITDQLPGVDELLLMTLTPPGQRKQSAPHVEMRGSPQSSDNHHHHHQLLSGNPGHHWISGVDMWGNTHSPIISDRQISPLATSRRNMSLFSPALIPDRRPTTPRPNSGLRGEESIHTDQIRSHNNSTSSSNDHQWQQQAVTTPTQAAIRSDDDSHIDDQSEHSTPSSSRRYPCKFSGCGKAFSQSGGLARHHRTHTGWSRFDYLFVCLPCLPCLFVLVDGVLIEEICAFAYLRFYSFVNLFFCV
jgi:hypothetical protein